MSAPATLASPLTPASASLLKLHPTLWRGSQFSTRTCPTVSTGFSILDAELPGSGWPAGALIELLTPQPGVGEIKFLRSALHNETKQPVIFLSPPYQPNIACCSNWRIDPYRLLYLTPQRARDAYWAAEQILKNGSCAALLFWAHPIETSVLKRLHLAAQHSQTLFFMFRPSSVRTEASPAALRVLLSPGQAGTLALSILKRRGPACGHTIELAFPPSEPFSTITHDPVDWPTPVQPQSRHVATPLAN
jgi:protein ImuA